MDRRADYSPQKKISLHMKREKFKIYQLENRGGGGG